jgi:hypothetical protein
MQPALGLIVFLTPIPKVVSLPPSPGFGATSQPWADGFNPFGIFFTPHASTHALFATAKCAAETGKKRLSPLLDWRHLQVDAGIG